MDCKQSVSASVLLLAVCSWALLVGCHEKEPEAAETPIPVVQVREQGPEIQLPSQLWDLLLKEEGGEKPAAGGEGGEGGGEGGGEKKAGGEKAAAEPELKTASFLYGAVDVVLKEKNPGVLKQPSVRISLPEGGGEIDLAKWTTGKPGTFFVRFEWEGLEPAASENRVFFYSRARKRRVGDQTIGSGCREFMNLTSYLTGFKKDEGMTVNTTRHFEDSVLGGHFLFSWKNETNRKVTRVSFNDSSSPQYFCGKEK